MGFYLRKSFRAGPIRFNLSKRGIGASIGVTGARIGMSSEGRAYVHGGRGGLYYRKSLGTGGGARSGDRGAGAARPAPGPIELTEDTGVTYGAPREKEQATEALATPVRRYVIDKEGALLVTSRRVALVHQGVSSFPLGKILDAEGEQDRQLLVLTRDGVATPTYLTTPDALRAGAIVAALTETA